MTSENFWYSATPTITVQVSGGGPIFDGPHPEATDEPEPEPSVYEIFQAAVGK